MIETAGSSLFAGAGRLLVALALVAALAVSTPVACWCAPADHAGQTLHPLFAHVHPHADDDEVAVASIETTVGIGWNVAVGHGSPSWSAAAQVVAPAPLWVSALLLFGALQLDVLRPSEIRLAPSFPPPR